MFGTSKEIQRELLAYLQRQGGNAFWFQIFDHLKAKGLIPPGHRPEDEGIEPWDVLALKELRAD